MITKTDARDIFTYMFRCPVCGGIRRFEMLGEPTQEYLQQLHDTDCPLCLMKEACKAVIHDQIH